MKIAFAGRQLALTASPLNRLNSLEGRPKSQRSQSIQNNRQKDGEFADRTMLNINHELSAEDRTSKLVVRFGVAQPMIHGLLDALCIFESEIQT